MERARISSSKQGQWTAGQVTGACWLIRWQEFSSSLQVSAESDKGPGKNLPEHGEDDQRDDQQNDGDTESIIIHVQYSFVVLKISPCNNFISKPPF